MHELEKNILYIFAFVPVSPGALLPWVITACIGFGCWYATKELTSYEPGPAQNFVEFVYENLEIFVKMIVGEKLTKKLLPVLSTIFIYIFSANIMGIVPGLKSPTSLFSNCLGMALVVFFLTAYYGFKNHGFIGYLKHFTGPVWWMAPLMFPIHIIGEISRPISLTLRLFGNIMGEDVVILVLTSIIFPLLVPLPMLFLALFTSLLQALVFTILSGVYLSGAISEGH
ncbi:MAG: F0F1 ATP synthase subunit A [Candidatus Rifleibacteriota bacterium]